MRYRIEIKSDGFVIYRCSFESLESAWVNGIRMCKMLGIELQSHPIIESYVSRKMMWQDLRDGLMTGRMTAEKDDGLMTNVYPNLERSAKETT